MPTARVLLIEDEERIQRLCRRILERTGLAIVGAHSLAEGLKALRAKRFDLLISDMILPDGSGLEALREFRRLNPSAPMIAMTGAASEETESRAKDLGGCRTLYKPFDIAELEGAVEAAVPRAYAPAGSEAGKSRRKAEPPPGAGR